MKLSQVAACVMVLAGVSSAASAQTGTARGKVVDQEGEPVAEAVINIESVDGLPTRFEITTDEDGEFRQVGLRPGKYRFTVTLEGYRATYVEYGIGLGDPTELPDIALPKAGEGDSERAQVNALFQEAIGLAGAGTFDEAQAKLEEAIALRPRFPEAYYNLGYIHIQREEWDEAETALKKAIELRGGYNEARMALSSVYQRTGRDKEAEALIEESAAGGGEDARVYFNLGVMKFNAGDTAAAVKAFTRAAELAPDNPEALYYLGTLAVQEGRTEDAVRHLEDYLSRSPKNEQNVATAKGLLQAFKP